MANIAANITTGKPKVSGAVYIAPIGTTVPTDATTSLAADFKCLGYVSDAGITNADALSTGEIKAWGGDTVLTYTDGHSDTWQFTLLESLNDDVLKAVYGPDNVSGAISTGMTVKSTKDDRPYSVWVFEMVLAGDAVKRVVLPEAKISTIGDVTYVDAEPVGYDVTVATRPDTAGVTHYEYIKG